MRRPDDNNYSSSREEYHRHQYRYHHQQQQEEEEEEEEGERRQQWSEPPPTPVVEYKALGYEKGASMMRNMAASKEVLDTSFRAMSRLAETITRSSAQREEREKFLSELGLAANHARLRAEWNY